MTAIVTRGDAAHLHLPDASVDLVVTSPPYFGLRSYQDGGEHYAGQIGAEPTPAEYLDALITCTREWMRCLKPGGSIFVNLGDKYGPNKSLGMLPQRYAIRCTDELDLILRAEIVWAKPNGLPESVTDRVRRSHEQVFHFVKQPRYYSAVDEIREPHVTTGRGSDWRARRERVVNRDGYLRQDDVLGMDNAKAAHPLGKLPGSVWTIPTAPLRVPEELGIDHFAAYPPELVRRIVLGWSPRAVCFECGFLLGSSYDKGVLGVRGGNGKRAQAGTSAPVLFEEVLEQAHSPQQGVHEVPPTDDTGLRRAVEAGSLDGAEERLPHGTPAGHVGALGTPARAGGGRAPQERGEDGQPDRELGTALQERARSAAEAFTQAIPLPALRGTPADLRELVPCPHCGSDRIERAVIVDPFGGTGTTALVASVQGRVGISVDLSADYCRLAQWRTTDEKQRAKAAGTKPKPPRKPKPEPLAEVVEIPTGQLNTEDIA